MNLLFFSFLLFLSYLKVLTYPLILDNIKTIGLKTKSKFPVEYLELFFFSIEFDQLTILITSTS